jgi:hypothetical protein
LKTTDKPLPQIPVDIGSAQKGPGETPADQAFRILQRNNRARRNGLRARGT